MASGDKEVTGETKELSQLRMVQRPDWNGFDRVWEEKGWDLTQKQTQGHRTAHLTSKKTACTDTDDHSSRGGGSVWKFADCFSFLNKIGSKVMN